MEGNSNNLHELKDLMLYLKKLNLRSYFPSYGLSSKNNLIDASKYNNSYRDDRIKYIINTHTLQNLHTSIKDILEDKKITSTNK